MALTDIQAGDTTDVVRAKVNAAIEAIAAMAGESTRAQNAESGLGQAIGGKAGQAAIDVLTAAVGGKAAQAALDALTAALNQEVARAETAEAGLGQAVGGKAGQAALDALTAAVGGKAAQAALDALAAALNQEVARAEAAEAGLGQAVGGKAGQAALDALTTAVGGKAAQAALDALAAALDSEVTRAETAEQAKAPQASLDAAVTDLLARLARVNAGLYPYDRPGDNPASFTAVPNGDPNASQAIDTGVYPMVVVADGRALQISGSREVWTRRATPYEPGRAIRARWRFSRIANPVDPSDDAITLLIQWFDASFAPLGGPQTVATVTGLRAGDPPHEAFVTIGTGGQTGVDAVPPTGGVYPQLGVHCYGAEPRTALTDMGTADVADIRDLVLKYLPPDSLPGLSARIDAEAAARQDGDSAEQGRATAAEQALQGRIATLQAAYDALVAGTPASLDTFLEAYNRFITDENALAAVMASIASEVARAKAAEAAALQAIADEVARAKAVEQGLIALDKRTFGVGALAPGDAAAPRSLSIDRNGAAYRALGSRAGENRWRDPAGVWHSGAARDGVTLVKRTFGVGAIAPGDAAAPRRLTLDRSGAACRALGARTGEERWRDPAGVWHSTAARDGVHTVKRTFGVGAVAPGDAAAPRSLTIDRNGAACRALGFRTGETRWRDPAGVWHSGAARDGVTTVKRTFGVGAIAPGDAAAPRSLTIDGNGAACRARGSRTGEARWRDPAGAWRESASRDVVRTVKRTFGVGALMAADTAAPRTLVLDRNGIGLLSQNPASGALRWRDPSGTWNDAVSSGVAVALANLRTTGTSVPVPATTFQYGTKTFAVPAGAVSSPEPAGYTATNETVAMPGVGGDVPLASAWIGAAFALASSDGSITYAEGADYSLIRQDGRIKTLSSRLAGTTAKANYGSSTSRLDLISWNAATSTYTLSRGAEVLREPNIAPPTWPSGEFRIARVYRGPGFADLCLLTSFRGGVCTIISSEIEAEIARSRRALDTARAKAMRGASLVFAFTGDSITQHGGGGAASFLNTNPNGAYRDYDGYYENYTSAMRAKAYVAPYGVTAVTRTDADTNTSNTHCLGGYWWPQVRKLQVLGGTVTGLNFGIAGTDSSATVQSNGCDNMSHPDRLAAYRTCGANGGVPDSFGIATGQNELGSRATYANVKTILDPMKAAGVPCIIMTPVLRDALWVGGGTIVDIYETWRFTCMELARLARDDGHALVYSPYVFEPSMWGSYGLSSYELAGATSKNHPGLQEFLMLADLATKNW